MNQNTPSQQSGAGSGGQASCHNQGHNPLSPGRIITSERPVHLPDGSQRVFREVTVTVKDQQGIYRTEQTQELFPPLDCGCQPQDQGDIYQCCRCFSVMCEGHSFTCSSCGRLFCTGCRKTVRIEAKGGYPQIVEVCVDCAHQIRTPLIWLLLDNLFFGI